MTAASVLGVGSAGADRLGDAPPWRTAGAQWVRALADASLDRAGLHRASPSAWGPVIQAGFPISPAGDHGRLSTPLDRPSSIWSMLVSEQCMPIKYIYRDIF